MILKDLISNFSFEEVWKRLVELYPDQEKNLEGYKNSYSILKGLKPSSNKEKVSIDIMFVDNDGDQYHDISGTKPDDPLSYALEFSGWDEWLSFSITKETIEKYPEVDILAHCLWELTFLGYSPEEIEEENMKLITNIEKAKDYVDKKS